MFSGKRVAVTLGAVLAVGLGVAGCGGDDQPAGGSAAPSPPSTSRNALEQQALETFCQDLQQQTGLDLNTADGAAAAVIFFDRLLQSAPSDIVEAVQTLRDSFQRIATATAEQFAQIRSEILQPVQAAFTAVGGFQQSQCQRF